MSNVAQRSFAAGELAPPFYARTDIAKYIIGLRTCRNFIIMREGGAAYRPGTEFADSVMDPTIQQRLIPFIFNVRDSLVLEFGDQKLRFFQDGAPVVAANAPAYSDAVDYVPGDIVSTGFPPGGVTYVCLEANGPSSSLIPPPYPGVWYPLVDTIFEMTTPYAAADIETLNFVQSGDIVTLVHPLYPPYELRRLSNTHWQLVEIIFAPSAAAPTGIAATGTGSSGPHTWQYAITAIDDVTGEESLPDAPNTFYFFSDPTAAAPHSITCTAVPGCTVYNVYVGINLGALGLLGQATIKYSTPPTFLNTGAEVPDFSTQPPQPFTDFTDAGNYPSVVGFYQQRRIFASTLNNPARVWASRSGDYANFNQTTPLTDDGPIVFTMVSDEVDQIKHILNLGKLIIGTEGAEWLCDGDSNGVMTPAQVNDRIGSYNGCNALKPVKVDNTILYVQALAGRVLELKTNVLYGYYTFQGADISIMSSHLLKGFTIVDWANQQNPNGIVWIVRSDGALLGLTYLPDQQLIAWHRHDTDGFVENVCVVPEGNEDAVYLIVRRVVNGATARYVERMRPIDIIDYVADPVFMDAALEYDGRNAGAAGSVTMELTYGTDWVYDETLILQASGNFFTSEMVDDAIVLHAPDGSVVTFTIDGYTDAQHVTGFPNITVPMSMRATPIALWDHAVPRVGGLSHLEAKSVSVFADGFVVASPNNSSIDIRTVAAGVVTLDRPYAHIWVGLPYIGDLETLDIDTAGGESLKDMKVLVNRVGLFVESSRGIFAGQNAPAAGADPLDELDEFKLRDEDDDMTQPPPTDTGYIYANIDAQWSRGGRMFVRQVDPVPVSVLAAVPQGSLTPAR
ncbi:MAG TPA: hypothetical protein VGI97_14735 [Gemmatimonadaceae bacterium]|jgi:hypothetical protein